MFCSQLDTNLARIPWTIGNHVGVISSGCGTTVESVIYFCSKILYSEDLTTGSSGSRVKIHL